MVEISGIGISGQKASAKAFICKKRLENFYPKVQQAPEKEKLRLGEIILEAKKEIQTLMKRAKNDNNAWQIFETHELLLEDPELKKYIFLLIDQGYDLLSALIRTEKDMEAHFQCMESEIFKSKVCDIEDVFEKLISIESKKKLRIDFPNEPFILVCDEILPSMIYQVPIELLKGIIVKFGSNCSHGAILAREKDIPVVIRLKNKIDLVKPNQTVTMNGKSGNIFIDNN